MAVNGIAWGATAGMGLKSYEHKLESQGRPGTGVAKAEKSPRPKVGGQVGCGWAGARLGGTHMQAP